MPQKPRETRYARELASVKLPSAAGGKALVAIERLHVKADDQVKIRFSSWQGARMQPKPLDLTEADLVPLLAAAIEGGVLSEEFVGRLRAAIGGSVQAPAATLPASDLDKVQLHFHQLIRSRAGDTLGAQVNALPRLARDEGTEEAPLSFQVEGMNGEFKFWWDASTRGLRLMSESWSRSSPGSGQLHEVTPAGSRLLGEGFV